MSRLSLEDRTEAAAVAERGGLRPVLLAGFMDQAALAWPFTVYPLVPRELVTLLAGHGGAGKSMLMLTWLAHAACGRSWSGFEFAQCRCLYVSLEDAGDLVRYRLKRIAEAYDLDPVAIEQNLVILDVAGGDSALAYEYSDQGVRRLVTTQRWEELAAAVEGVGWIAIDNASDAFDGNENERRQVRAFLRQLTELASQHAAAVTLLAHIDKTAARQGSNGNSYSGSTAWHNSVRSRLALTTGEDGTVVLTQEKLNLGKKAEPVALRWNDHGVLMPVAMDPEGDVRAENRDRDDAHDALRALAAASNLGMEVTAATSGPATSWHALQPLPSLPEQFRSRDGRQRLHSALMRLVGEGLVEREQYRTPSRNTKQRWALTNAGEIFVKSLRAAYTPIPPARTHARGGAREWPVGRTDEALTKDSRTNESLAAAAFRAVKDGGE